MNNILESKFSSIKGGKYMEELIIYSPRGIPNKESYLAGELKRIAKRRICSIKMQENGDIKILLKNDITQPKYYIRVVKKKEEDYFDIINFIDKDEIYIKSSMLIKCLEYDSFFVLFFKKIK